MTQADIDAAVELLDGWADSHPSTPLNWSRFTSITGFTRPALSAKESIQAAFVRAKEVQRDVKARSKASPNELERLRGRISELEDQVDTLRAAEEKWLTDWQKVLCNLMEMGINAADVLAPISAAHWLHTEDAIDAFKKERGRGVYQKRGRSDKK
ncbi:hypothetical protein C7402_109317 [Paraburkholderia unamae]|uniref:Uncharacterized protein n=2 Tax=Paraburkholderia unamae TaxID=219649 RepID=A0ABX5KR37_9BURK|nr:hypothetical protein C7402_109317 [Paraburkholderia unamae]